MEVARLARAEARRLSGRATAGLAERFQFRCLQGSRSKWPIARGYLARLEQASARSRLAGKRSGFTRLVVSAFTEVRALLPCRDAVIKILNCFVYETK